MGLFLNILTLPMLGTPRLVHWLAEEMTHQARQEFLDEGRVRAQLLELEARYDLGEVDEEAYARHEGALVERLEAIREAKGGEGRR